jgi:hypothetical protein
MYKWDMEKQKCYNITQENQISQKLICPSTTLSFINSTDCTVLNKGLYDEKAVCYQTMAYAIENTSFCKV